MHPIMKGVPQLSELMCVTSDSVETCVPSSFQSHTALGGCLALTFSKEEGHCCFLNF